MEKLWLKTPCAYVIYDAARNKALPVILSTLEDHGIHSIGRYGAWKYSFMEESVKEGLETAKKNKSIVNIRLVIASPTMAESPLPPP